MTRKEAIEFINNNEINWMSRYPLDEKANKYNQNVTDYFQVAKDSILVLEMIEEILNADYILDHGNYHKLCDIEKLVKGWK